MTPLRIRWTIPLSIAFYALALYSTTVPNLGSRDRDVVVVRRTISSGKPRGVGNLEWGGTGEGMGRGCEGEGQFTSNLRPRWRDRITPKEGFQVSKGEMEGKANKESARGVKQGDCAITCVVNLCTCI